MRIPAFLDRLGAAVGALLQRWRTARTERARRLALAHLTEATRRDLGLGAIEPDHEYWPASRWTARHHVERYL